MKTARNRKSQPADATVPSQPDGLPYIAASLRSLAVPCASLTLDPANARQHPAKNLDAIKGSLRTFGQVKAIVVRQQTNVVVCGNGTLAAARSLGWSHIAANIIPLTDAQATALSIADNRASELGLWHQQTLDELLASVHVDDPDLQRMFDELQTTLPSALVEDEVPIDRADQLQKQWGTANGQLWVIPSRTAPPRHVVICPNCQRQLPGPGFPVPARAVPVRCPGCQEEFQAEPVEVSAVHKLLCADSTNWKTSAGSWLATRPSCLPPTLLIWWIIAASGLTTRARIGPTIITRSTSKTPTRFTKPCLPMALK
jgi:hypothetical protein